MVAILASCGIGGPLLFVSSMGVASFFRPDHDPTSQLVSDLGRGGTTYASLMNVGGFIVPGILTILFGAALFLAIAPGGWRWTGPACISLGGVGMMGAGVFSNDPTSEILANSAMLHQIFTIIVMGGATFGPLLLAREFGGDPRWRGYKTLSLVIAPLVILTVSIMFIDYFRAWQGALERAFAGLMFIWTEAVAIRLAILSLKAGRSGAAQEKAETDLAAQGSGHTPRRFFSHGVNLAHRLRSHSPRSEAWRR